MTVKVTILEAKSESDIQAAFALRYQVFVKEQKCEATREIDEWDYKIEDEKDYRDEDDKDSRDKNDKDYRDEDEDEKDSRDENDKDENDKNDKNDNDKDKNDKDEKDKDEKVHSSICYHFVAKFDEINSSNSLKAVAAARLVSNYPECGTGKVGRMVVRSDMRKLGIGKKVLAVVEAKAKSLGLSKLKLHAQCDKIPFYESSGFQVINGGDVFYEEKIPHLAMIKVINKIE